MKTKIIKEFNQQEIENMLINISLVAGAIPLLFDSDDQPTKENKMRLAKQLNTICDDIFNKDYKVIKCRE